MKYLVPILVLAFLILVMPFAYVLVFHVGCEVCGESTVRIDALAGEQNWGLKNKTTAYYYYATVLESENDFPLQVLLYVPTIAKGDLQLLQEDAELKIRGYVMDLDTFSREVPEFNRSWVYLKEVKSETLWPKESIAISNIFMGTISLEYLPRSAVGHLSVASVFSIFFFFGMLAGLIRIIIGVRKKKYSMSLLLLFVLLWLFLNQLFFATLSNIYVFSY